MFNYKNIIDTSTQYTSIHHNTRFNNPIGIIVPEPKTNFNKFYILIVFCKICTRYFKN